MIREDHIRLLPPPVEASKHDFFRAKLGSVRSICLLPPPVGKKNAMFGVQNGRFPHISSSSRLLWERKTKHFNVNSEKSWREF